MPILLEIIGKAAEAERIARALDGAGPFRAQTCDLAQPVPAGAAAADFLLFLREGANPTAKEDKP